jgi:asparagine synthase (glutamine-hydrolysing)
MCGIISGNNYLIEESEIIKSLTQLDHRGPDEKHYEKLADIFLGHTRLSIVDVNGGHQPLFNENKIIAAVVNGEFYDHKKIREDLVSKGHVFKTLSDSEILIHLYEEYGVECLKKLHGEFAFVLYDKNKEQWFCARDRVGIRPLQFYFKDGMFLIASEAKALLEFKKVQTEFDREAFWFAQHLQYLPLNRTLFKNIEMIKPGHFLILKKGDIPKQFEYWSLRDVEQKNISFEEAKEHAKYLISKAVEKRIPDEVRWATHLSGGIDSTIVTALSSQYNGKDTTAFTIQFTDDGFYDESQFAKETANYLGINLVTIPVSFSDLIDNIPKAVYHAEGLSINGHLGAKYILNREINKAGFKVALSGEGSDEIFMGYSHLKQDYLTANALKNLEKQYLTGFQLPDGNTLDLSFIEKSLGFVPTWIQAKSSMAFKFQKLWSKNFKFDINPYELISHDLEGYQSKLKASSASWIQYCLSGYILKVLDDAQAMAHHIEGRLPFLDTELMEYMYSVPDSVYFYNDIEKGLLREGFKNNLPESIIKKTKQSFMSPPINRFLKNKQFTDLIEQYILSNKKLENLEIFEKKALLNLLKEDNTEKNNNLEPIIMVLLCTGILVEKFL